MHRAWREELGGFDVSGYISLILKFRATEIIFYLFFVFFGIFFGTYIICRGDANVGICFVNMIEYLFFYFGTS